MFLKIIIFIFLFIIIRKMLQVGAFLYNVKKQVNETNRRAKKEAERHQYKNSPDVIDAEFRVISEEK